MQLQESNSLDCDELELTRDHTRESAYLSSFTTTMTIELFYAQGRRIECDSCQQPFVYIHGGGESAQTTGVPVVSNDDKMRDNALRQAIRSLNKLRRNSKSAKANALTTTAIRSSWSRTLTW